MGTINKYFDLIKESKTKFFVDIGASCVTAASESEILVENGWSGIMFECDPNKYPIQIKKMNGKDIKVLPVKVTPDNILIILKENNAPLDFYLTLDIDGYDFFVLEKILSHYKPQLIISEINEKIPANIKFSVKYDEDYFWDGSHYYGYSILMLEDILTKYGYKIESLDWNNVVLVPGIQEESIEDVYNNGYLNKTDRINIYTYNLDFEPIYSLSKEEQLNFIETRFSSLTNERQGTYGHQIDGRPVTYRNYILE
jgi:hypothetical protein